MKVLLTFFTIITSATLSFSQDYKSFLQGTFHYCEDFPGTTITFKGRKVVEETILSDGSVGLKITSKIKWIDASSYRLTAVKVEGTDSFKKGDFFIMKLQAMEGNEVQYTYRLNSGITGNDCFRKVSK